jgi:hypothetical protein
VLKPVVRPKEEQNTAVKGIVECDDFFLFRPWCSVRNCTFLYSIFQPFNMGYYILAPATFFFINSHNVLNEWKKILRFRQFWTKYFYYSVRNYSIRESKNPPAIVTWWLITPLIVLKGLGHQIETFFEGLYNFICIFCTVQIVFKILACLVKEINKIKISACFSENTYTISKDFFESRIKLLFRLSYSLTGWFLSV